MKKVPCRDCGKLIVWGRDTRTNKPVPLDAIAPVFSYSFDDESAMPQTEDFVMRVDPDDGCGGIKFEGKWFVSHFSTCSKANNFSSARPKFMDVIVDTIKKQLPEKYSTDEHYQIEFILDGKELAGLWEAIDKWEKK